MYIDYYDDQDSEHVLRVYCKTGRSMKILKCIVLLQNEFK